MLPGADKSGFLQVLGPSARSPVEKWMWGDLKQAILFYQDLKGQSKGAISLTNARMTVIKTKEGRVWKPTNYIRLVNPDRALLGEYRECVLFFRNGKEMEEWYLALRVATNLHIPKHLSSQTARRQHYSALMRAIGFDWQNASIPMIPRPASVGAVPGEHGTPSSSPQPHHHHSISVDDSSLGKATSGSAPSSPGSSHVDSKWVNLLAHRVWNFLHDDPGFVGLVKKQISKKLAKLKKPKMLKSLGLKNITFGSKLPIGSNISIRGSDPDGNLRLDADIAYHGAATIELDLVIEVEILGKKLATIPVSLKVVIKSIIGRIQLAFSPPPSDTMWLGFYTEPHIELDIESFIGEKHRLINIPQLTNIIVLKLRQEIVEMMLLPDMDDWPLPHLKVPRGEVREKYVDWEYQAGYTPPPKIRTAFDSSSDSDDADLAETTRYQDPKNFASNAAGPSSSSPSSHPFASTFASSTDVPLVSLKNKPGNATSSSASHSSSTSSHSPPTPSTAPHTSNSSSDKSRSSAQTTFSSNTFPASPASSKPLPTVPTTQAPPKLPPKPTFSVATAPMKEVQRDLSGAKVEISSPPAAELPPSSFPIASFSAMNAEPSKPKNAPATVPHSVEASSALHVDVDADRVVKSSAQRAEETNTSKSNTSSSSTTTDISEARVEIAPLSSSLIEFDNETTDAIFGPQPGTKKPVEPSGPITRHETLVYGNTVSVVQTPGGTDNSETTKPLTAAKPDDLLVQGTAQNINHVLHLPADGSSPTLFSMSEGEKDAPKIEVEQKEKSSENVDLPSSPVVENVTTVEGNAVERSSSPETSDPKLNKSAAGILVDANYDPLLHPREEPPTPEPRPPIPVTKGKEPSSESSSSSSDKESTKQSTKDQNMSKSSSDSSVKSMDPPPRGIISDVIEVPTSLEPEEDNWPTAMSATNPFAKSASASSVSSTSSGQTLEDSNTAMRSGSMGEPQRTSHVSIEPRGSEVQISSTSSGASKPALPPRSVQTAPSGAVDPFDDIFAGASEHTTGFHAALSPPPQLPPRTKKASSNASPPGSTSFPSGIYAQGGASNNEQPKSWSSSSTSSSSSSSKRDSREGRKSTSVKDTFFSIIDSIKEKIDE